MKIFYDKEICRDDMVVRITAIGGPVWYPPGYKNTVGAVWRTASGSLILREESGDSCVLVSGMQYTKAEFEWELLS